MTTLKRKLFLMGTVLSTVMMFAEPAFAGFRAP